MTLPTETFQQQLNSGSADFIQQGRHTVSGWLNAIGEPQLNPLVLLVSEWLTNLHKHSEGSVTEVRLSPVASRAPAQAPDNAVINAPR